MSFLIACPTCGARDVNEFVYAGEVTSRPETTPTQGELGRYVYFRRNVAGVQREWWFHRFGCELWFIAERDTRSNEVLTTQRAVPRSPGEMPAPQTPAVPDTPAV